MISKMMHFRGLGRSLGGYPPLRSVLGFRSSSRKAGNAMENFRYGETPVDVGDVLVQGMCD